MPRRVKSAWDDEDEDEIDQNIVDDFANNAGLGSSPQAAKVYDWQDKDWSDDEDEIDAAFAEEEDRMMRDNTTRPVVQGRASFKRNASKYAVDEAMAKHHEKEFELAKLTMKKKSSGSGSSLRGSQDALDFGRPSYTYRGGGGRGSDFQEDELERLVQLCCRIIDWATGDREEMPIPRVNGGPRKAVEAVVNKCRAVMNKEGKGRDTRWTVARASSTRGISRDEMEQTVLEVLNNKPERRSGYRGDRGDRGDRDRTRSGPVKLTPNKEIQMRQLEVTVNGKPLEEGNAGRAMLKMMGWSEGSGLGVKKDGRTEPVPVKINMSRRGLGTE